jgi:hypothetical protein|tara:strand:+ start:1865 stop:2137 length:273 start_codon:yes stop_codon:yes gene_type:complete
MKLTDILVKEASMGYTSSEPTLVNKETGTLSWDISPTPLKGSISALDEALELLEKAVKTSPEDVKLKQYEELLSKLKKSLKTHVTRTYGK